MNTNRAGRVCILSEEFYPVMAGVEVHVMTLAEQLREKGTEVFIVTRRLTARLAKRDDRRGIPIYRIPPQGAGPLKKWLMLVPAMSFLIRMRAEYDIIYAPSFRTLGIPAVLASKLLRKGCVLMEAVHGEMSGEIFDLGLQRVKLSRAMFLVRTCLQMRNWLLRGADLFISNSSDVTREYRECGIDHQKIRFIPHGVDTDRFHPVSSDQKRRLRHKLGWSPEKTIVIFVGRLVSYKGLPLLMHVWKKVRSRRGDVQLVLVGPGGGGAAYDCESQLRAFVTANSLQESVTFTGQVESVEEYLQAADIFMFPSAKDTFAIALIEAMSCGLPVVVAPAGGPKEIVTHGQNGIYASDVDDFDKALEDLLTDNSLAASLGRAARQTAVDKYGRAREMQEYLGAFTSVRPTQRGRKAKRSAPEGPSAQASRFLSGQTGRPERRS